MNKRSIRAFAIGILISVSIIGSFYYFLDDEKNEHITTIEEAKVLLNESGFVVLEKQKYSEMESTITELTKKESAKPNKTEEVKNPKDKDKILSFNLKIVNGMISHDIASMLEKEKIIDDADSFETYLKENGYSTRIQLGTFEVKEGMSYKNIADIITKS